MSATFNELASSAQAPGAFPGVVRVPSWSDYSWLYAGFSTRLGGESRVYGEGDLNLGLTQADNAAIVSRNRERFLSSVGASDLNLVTVRQFHSNLICRVDAKRGNLLDRQGGSALRGDGLITDVPGVTLGVQTADCTPVLVADLRQRVVGAFHAGWRGTLSRIVQRGVGDFRACYQSRPDDLVAAIGPCIGACCFEIGTDLRPKFEGQFAYSAELFTEQWDYHSCTKPSLHLDLVEANRQQLLDAGLGASHITVVRECTACTRTRSGSRKYFSHRADRGFTGRMLSVIGIAAAL